MDQHNRMSPTSWSSFAKPYWVFGVVFTILMVFVAYLMAKVYQSSSLLAEASRTSFSQEARTRASNLDGYFERLKSDVETLSKSKALHAYYQNKALGMSLQYGLAVAVAEVRDEFERFQRTLLTKGHPISQQILLLDSRDMRVVAQTQDPVAEKSVDIKRMSKAIEGSKRFPMFTVLGNGSGWDAFAVTLVTYKAETRGYLVMKLDLDTIRSLIEIDDLPVGQDFYIILDSLGFVFVGPKEFVGKNIAESFGVIPTTLEKFSVIDIPINGLTGVRKPLIVSGGEIPDTPFYVVRIAPTMQFLAGYSTYMWVMVFSALMLGLVIMALFIYRSFLEQSRTYGQLQEARDTLEVRVEERTSELAETNLILQQEIKARSSVEESLRQSETRYRDLFEHASDLIYTRDLEGRFTSVNGVVLSLLGYSPAEFLALDYHSILDKESHHTIEENFFSVLRDEIEHIGPYELLARSKDGVPVWLEVTSRLIKRDDQAIGVHCIARNVTERKELEAAVREAQMKYQSVVEAFEGLIHISSSKHQILFANQQLIERTGYDPVGEKCYKVVHGLSEVCPWCTFGRISADERCRSELLSPGDDRWYYVVSSPMAHQDGSVSRIFLMHDIDDQKRAEEDREKLEQHLAQAQKMEAVGTLAGGIAHDFNNLLQVVLGYSQLLLASDTLRPKEHENLEKINKAARQGADLVKGLLTFSRKALTTPNPVNMNDQVKEVIDLLERTIPKMIRIELRLEENLPIICADSGQIKQILMNLALNARDAMPNGGTITIETRSEVVNQDFCRRHIDARPGHYCMLSVSDTGQGMDAETLGHIFEPFYTTKEVGRGTGLGLSMVFGMVKQHGGFITCQSEVNRGAALNIYFPEMTEIKEPIQLEKLVSTSPKQGGETILLVDDEELVRDLGSDYLREIGYNVLTASNGSHAIDIYRENQPRISLVLLDLIMPEMDGKNCLKELRKINSDVKVIMVSGYSSANAPEESLVLGAKGFVYKPYDLTKLLHTIRNVLDAT